MRINEDYFLVTTDARGRARLPQSLNAANRAYAAEIEEDGTLVLHPVGELANAG